MLELLSIPAKELVAKRTEAHHTTVLYIFIHIFFLDSKILFYA